MPQKIDRVSIIDLKTCMQLTCTLNEREIKQLMYESDEFNLSEVFQNCLLRLAALQKFINSFIKINGVEKDSDFPWTPNAMMDCAAQAPLTLGEQFEYFDFIQLIGKISAQEK